MTVTWRVTTDTHWGEARENPNHPTMARTATQERTVYFRTFFFSVQLTASLRYIRHQPFGVYISGLFTMFTDMCNYHFINFRTFSSP